MESREGNWQEFEIWLQDLLNRSYRRGLIFRGQTNSEWPLKTTLERSGHSAMPIAEYYDLIVRQVGPSVSSFSSMQAPSFNENTRKKLSDYERYKESILDQTAFPGGEYFEYAAYLRHHRFPSPLLDWSQSPYVAAFFAFCDAEPKVEKRAILSTAIRPREPEAGLLENPRYSCSSGILELPAGTSFSNRSTLCAKAKTMEFGNLIRIRKSLITLAQIKIIWVSSTFFRQRGRR